MNNIFKFSKLLFFVFLIIVLEISYVFLNYDLYLFIFIFLLNFSFLAVLFFLENKIKQDRLDDEFKNKIIFDSLDEFVCVRNLNNEILSINKKLAEFLLVDLEKIKGKKNIEINNKLFNLLEVFSEKEKIILPYENYDQRKYFLEIENFKLPIKEDVLNISLIKNVTLQQEIEKKLNLISKVFVNCSEGIIITDNKFNIVQINESLINMLSLSNFIIGKDLSIIEIFNNNNEKIINQIKNNESWRGEVKVLKENGEYLDSILALSAVKGLDGFISNYILFFTNISEQKKVENDLYILANHDFLTNLLNRNAITDCVKRLISLNKDKFSLLFIDLDRFKPINDNFGHKAGDKVLIDVAERINRVSKNFGNDNLAARLGGDEFVIIIKNHDLSTIYNVANNLIKEISTPCFFEGNELVVTPSIGIASYPVNGKTFDDLLKFSDIAMYKAKESGRANYKMFDEDMYKEIQEIYEHDLEETKKIIKDLD